MRGKINVSVCRGHELANALYSKMIAFYGLVTLSVYLQKNSWTVNGPQSFLQHL